MTELARVAFELPCGRFHALVAGDPAAPPLVYLHGFPDHPPTAAAFLTELARDHRVIAPWLRGYAPSPLTGPFDLDTLAADVIALIDELAAGPVVLVGHDWGAALTYAVAAAAPDRLHRAVTLALPHPLTFLRALRTPAQARRSWYMALFQLPGAGWLARRRDLALIDRLWRAWSPGLTLDAPAHAALHACLATSLPAPLAYYRAVVRGVDTLGRLRRLSRPLTTPLLQLHGADDGCVLAPGARDAHRFAQRDYACVPNAGHFLHLEQPVAIAARIRAWLA